MSTSIVAKKLLTLEQIPQYKETKQQIPQAPNKLQSVASQCSMQQEEHQAGRSSKVSEKLQHQGPRSVGLSPRSPSDSQGAALLVRTLNSWYVGQLSACLGHFPHCQDSTPNTQNVQEERLMLAQGFFFF